MFSCASECCASHPVKSTVSNCPFKHSSPLEFQFTQSSYTVQLQVRRPIRYSITGSSFHVKQEVTWITWWSKWFPTKAFLAALRLEISFWSSVFRAHKHKRPTKQWWISSKQGDSTKFGLWIQCGGWKHFRILNARFKSGNSSWKSLAGSLVGSRTKFACKVRLQKVRL